MSEAETEKGYVMILNVKNEDLFEYYKTQVDTFLKNKTNHYRDSGFDLFVPNKITSIEMSKDSPYKLDHEVSCSVFKHLGDNKFIPSGYYLYPRSSISKTPFRLANNVGIIDSGYRGNLIAKLDCIYNTNYEVNKGDRLFQICTPDLTPFTEINLVINEDDVNTTERGSGGFGSTGN